MEKRHVLSPAEKWLIVKCHQYFIEHKALNLPGKQARVRDSVSKCLGFAKSTVSSVIAEWNKNHDRSFKSEGRVRGHRPRSSVEHLATEIRQIIQESNAACLPVSAKSLSAEIAEQEGVTIPVRTMRRALRRMGFCFQKGQTRFFLAESSENVAFRTTYLRKKLSNRTHSGGVRLPEVYLDESYCNLNHSPGKTWVDETKRRLSKSGKGPRMCIVGAGIVSTDADGTKCGEWACNSLVMWPSQKRPKRQRKQASLVDDDDDDYHGNFNSELFEKWFTQLCGALQTAHGACVIHMDGAKYHKRVLNPCPTTATKKGEIIAWLTSKGVAFDPKQTKAELLVIVKANRERPSYASQVIATSYGHTLLFTPPYHPELQPIEVIWGIVKNKIACRPSSDMAELERRLKIHFAEVTSSQWLSAHDKSCSFENAYMEAAEDVILAQEEEPSDDGEGNLLDVSSESE
ncbi:hypothetical protein B5M09_009254 [Aphanomyces astaci]|uniref:Uncharacterized protein n=1 Tax=Aphanomyces astaci TaxID=112090 RepID=A0A425CY89_APHAT|nr:hypothetical protein B5M09_009254 [Aphanomyces astaci]